MVDWLSVTLWSLAATWILVVGTLFLMYWQTRIGQHLNSANAVMSLRERYDSDRMRAVRRHLSDRLIRQAHEDIANMEVINFFELVATLTHRKILDEDLVWEAFGTWISCYYLALRRPVDLIGQIRQNLDDPLVFHEFEWLYQRVRAQDQKHMRKFHAPAPESSPEEVERILKRESRLESI
jgi:hypothetical protein